MNEMTSGSDKLEAVEDRDRVMFVRIAACSTVRGEHLEVVVREQEIIPHLRFLKAALFDSHLSPQPLPSPVSTACVVLRSPS